MTSVCRSKASFRYAIVAVSGVSVPYRFTVSLSSSPVVWHFRNVVFVIRIVSRPVAN